jgi:hypothetical protein
LRLNAYWPTVDCRDFRVRAEEKANAFEEQVYRQEQVLQEKIEGKIRIGELELKPID